MARVEHHHVPLPVREEFRPQVAHLILPAPEGMEKLRACRVAKVDDVLGLEAQHVHDVAPEGVRVAVRERDGGDVAMPVVLVAHDHRHAVRVADLGARLSGKPCENDTKRGEQHAAWKEHSHHPCPPRDIPKILPGGEAPWTPEVRR